MKLYIFLEDFSIFKFLIPDTHITPIFHLSETLISIQILLLNIIHIWTVYSIFTKKKKRIIHRWTKYLSQSRKKKTLHELRPKRELQMSNFKSSCVGDTIGTVTHARRQSAVQSDSISCCSYSPLDQFPGNFEPVSWACASTCCARSRYLDTRPRLLVASFADVQRENPCYTHEFPWLM